MKKNIALIEVLIANILWGFGFTATVWSLESFSILQSLSLRFVIVGLIIGIYSVFYINKRKVIDLLKTTALPAFFLGGEVVFQVWGLKLTSPTKAGFITTLFVVIVPLLEQFFFKRKISSWHWIWVFIAIIGTYLIVGGALTNKINTGDLIILASALFASLHILSIDRLAKANDSLFYLNGLQALWIGALLFPVLSVQGFPDWSNVSIKSWLGLTSLTFGSTLLAFYFQMRAQKRLNPATCSLLFLMESPLAALFSYLFLADRLEAIQIYGCVLIFISAVGVTLTNRSKV